MLSTTLQELMAHQDETIQRNAMAIYKTLVKIKKAETRANTANDKQQRLPLTQ